MSSSTSSRRPVPLTKSYRLLNHGPTVLVSAAHEGKRNIMAAAWSMPVEFDPPKVAVVLDKSTWTRILLEASGYFVLNVPVVGQADIAYTVALRPAATWTARAGTSSRPMAWRRSRAR